MKLQELYEEVKEADLPLKESATNLVFGEGDPHARILIIGEAPGRNEDQSGRPFVGRAGKLLSEVLEGAGLSREQVYITNIVKYRPPNNRNPRQNEIRMHSPYLERQIHIIDPEFIVTLGNFSTKFVLAGGDLKKMKDIPGISQVRGKKHDVILGGSHYIVFPVYHPAAALYNPNLKPLLVKDFQKISDSA